MIIFLIFFFGIPFVGTILLIWRKKIDNRYFKSMEERILKFEQENKEFREKFLKGEIK